MCVVWYGQIKDRIIKIGLYILIMFLKGSIKIFIVGGVNWKKGIRILNDIVLEVFD